MHTELTNHVTILQTKCECHAMITKYAKFSCLMTLGMKIGRLNITYQNHQNH